MKKTVYDFAAAQGFKTTTDGTINDIADNLRKAALNLVNARWDEKNRDELILYMQYAATDALDFLDCIVEREVEQ